MHYIRSSELVRDIALRLVLRGWSPHPIKPPSIEESDASRPITDDICDLIREPVLQRWQNISVNQAASAAFHFFEKNLQKSIESHLHCTKWLQENQSEIFGIKNNVIITNYPYGGAALAIAQFARKINVPFCGVQHGVGRELIYQPQNACNYENTFGDRAIVFNDQATKILDKNPFKTHGSIVRAHGLPIEYSRVSDLGFLNFNSRRLPPILYVQPLNRTGNFFNNGIYKSDYQCFDEERKLIDKVFDKLPHKVGFKYYPHQSYPDAEPIFSHIEQSKNVELVSSNKDLKFFLHRANVAINTGVSSTLAWCLFSDTL